MRSNKDIIGRIEHTLKMSRHKGYEKLTRTFARIRKTVRATVHPSLRRDSGRKR